MNKLMMVAGAALIGSMIAGCASNQSNPIKAWQDSRFMAMEIKNVYTSEKKTLEVTDVMYKSKQEGNCLPLGIPVNALAPVPAALYLKVVTGVDELDAQLDGIELVREFNGKTDANNPERVAPEKVFEEWENAAKDGDPTYKNAKARYEACIVAIKNSDTEVLIPVIQDIIQVQIPKAMEDVQKTMAQVKTDLDSGKIKLDATGMELLGGLKVMAGDFAALGEQLTDAGVGAKHWLALAIEARDMKASFANMNNVSNK